MAQALRVGSLLALGVALLLLVLLVGRLRPQPTVELGRRGLRRRRALADGGLLALIEPMIRYFAAWSAMLPRNHRRRAVTEAWLQRSGPYWGLDADELLGWRCVSVLASTLPAVVWCALQPAVPWQTVVVFALLGLLLPQLQIATTIRQRETSIALGFPAAIDLAALCMGAGYDFVAAIRQIVHYSKEGDPLRDELEQILQELELGHTRKDALLAFAQRTPIAAVRDFVGAVVQSEERGNPLAEVLQVQASMLRMRRSIRAEEAAARAGVLMLLPLSMIFVCVLILVIGPFVLEQLRGGL